MLTEPDSQSLCRLVGAQLSRQEEGRSGQSARAVESQMAGWRAVVLKGVLSLPFPISMLQLISGDTWLSHGQDWMLLGRAQGCCHTL